MQSIQRYFADLSQRLGLADELIQLSPRRKSAKRPIQLGDVQDQTEVYLDLSSGGEASKGIITGTWGLGILYMAILALPVLRPEGEGIKYLMTFGGALALRYCFFCLRSSGPRLFRFVSIDVPARSIFKKRTGSTTCPGTWQWPGCRRPVRSPSTPAP